jgi:crossover junction endodeoxyribonuclease RuvC
MRILGVDPGSQKSGFGIIDVEGQRLRHVHHGVIRVGSGEFSERLVQLFRGLKAVIEEFHPDVAAMEDVFVSKNVASALKLGQARGALVAACGDADLAITPYSPTKVKQAVVGTGRAEKAQVQYMIKMLLKPQAPLPEDAADALAVCICHAHHMPMSNRTRTGTNTR